MNTDGHTHTASLADWQPRPVPGRVLLEGRYVRLEPLAPDRHGDALFAESMAGDAALRHRWMFESPQPRALYEAWLQQAAASEDPLFFAVVDARSGRAAGRQALMRIDPAHGVIEVGSILWGPSMARTRVATEALFLFADYIFGTLGYRRFEWKCDARNEPSRRAAERFGFQYEGCFRQHRVNKGENRDTAWFSLLDHEWTRLRRGYIDWLDADNFDGQGLQRRSLASFLANPSA